MSLKTGALKIAFASPKARIYVSEDFPLKSVLSKIIYSRSAKVGAVKISKKSLQRHVDDLAWRRDISILLTLLRFVGRRGIPVISQVLVTFERDLDSPTRRTWLEEKFLAKYMLPDPGKCYVDVGAQIGLWSVFIAERGFKVYAFEPCPSTFYVLKMKEKQHKNIHCYAYALGDKNSTIQMQAYTEYWWGGAVGKGSLTVPLRTLDSLHLENVGVIKIDTEGFEYPVLMGALKTIRKQKPRLVIEIHEGVGAAKQTLEEEFQRIRKLLLENSYSTRTIYRRYSLNKAQPFILAYPATLN